MRLVPVALALLFLLLNFSLLPTAQAGARFQRGTCVPGKVTGFTRIFRSWRSGYFPEDSEMEGGFLDRRERPLNTLQSYLRGRASYVSVAMDHLDRSLPYGTVVRIPAVEKYFNRCIEFRIVDTGDRFKGKRTKKIDICNNTEDQTFEDYTNGMADVYVLAKP